MDWPVVPEALIALQRRLADDQPPPWRPSTTSLKVGAVFVCFPRGAGGAGACGDPGWAGAAVLLGSEVVATARVQGPAGAAYRTGLLAAREGALLERAARTLPVHPDVLLVNATGRDHPRRAGLALHLGAVLGLPTIGVTHRPLCADGSWPGPERGASGPLLLETDEVACWLRTCTGARPLAIHPAWRTDHETACWIVLRATGSCRTPRPLRMARRVAREARAQALTQEQRPVTSPGID